MTHEEFNRRTAYEDIPLFVFEYIDELLETIRELRAETYDLKEQILDHEE